MGAILHAKATGVPIVLEGFEKSEFKRLTALGLESEAAVERSLSGGRGQTVSLIHPPRAATRSRRRLDAVNRAIDKHAQTLAQATLDPTRQAYAENIWTVWLHTGKTKNPMLPYYASEDIHYPQTGNLDFGCRYAGGTDAPLSKIINLQYMAPLHVVAPACCPSTTTMIQGHTPWTCLCRTFTARYGAQLNGSTVQPTATIGQHSVTKTNGFSWGLRSTCGANTTGPSCSITGDFSFSSQTQKTQTIAELVIDTNTSFGQIAYPTLVYL